MSNYKRIFMDGYSYFITVVTHKRNPILIQNIALLRESFHVSKQKYIYEIEAIVILPDHFHMVITPKYAEDYPHIVRTIKQHFSKHCPKEDYTHLQQSFSREKKGYSLVWQKRFYEHTIRNEKNLMEKMQYIQNNPVKHGYIEDISEWKYSSFYSK
ncbi:MAG TPA: transposase [Epsilonproteobacteria bacterium]|nr:transposase [Campylobacterota bacterium]